MGVFLNWNQEERVMFIFSMLLLSACCNNNNCCNNSCNNCNRCNNCNCHQHQHHCSCGHECRRGCRCTRCQKTDCTHYTFFESGMPVDRMTVYNSNPNGASTFGSYSGLNACNSEAFYNRQYGLDR